MKKLILLILATLMLAACAPTAFTLGDEPYQRQMQRQRMLQQRQCLTPAQRQEERLQPTWQRQHEYYIMGPNGMTLMEPMGNGDYLMIDPYGHTKYMIGN